MFINIHQVKRIQKDIEQKYGTLRLITKQFISYHFSLKKLQNREEESFSRIRRRGEFS
jgi:hypothetical protein